MDGGGGGGGGGGRNDTVTPLYDLNTPYNYIHTLVFCRCKFSYTNLWLLLSKQLQHSYCHTPLGNAYNHLTLPQILSMQNDHSAWNVSTDRDETLYMGYVTTIYKRNGQKFFSLEKNSKHDIYLCVLIHLAFLAVGRLLVHPDHPTHLHTLDSSQMTQCRF